MAKSSGRLVIIAVAVIVIAVVVVLAVATGIFVFIRMQRSRAAARAISEGWAARIQFTLRMCVELAESLNAKN